MIGNIKQSDRRKKGDKNPNFLSKLEILLFLLNGEKSRPDIINHMEKEKQVSNPKGIDKHLNELINDGYIVKRIDAYHDGKGIPKRFFKLDEKYLDYYNFKALYKFIMDHGDELNKKHNVDKDWDLEFTKSQFAQDMINKDIIEKISFDIVKIIHPLESIIFGLKSGENFNEIEDGINKSEITENEKTELLEILKIIVTKTYLQDIIEQFEKGNYHSLLGDIFYPHRENKKVMKLLDKINEYLSDRGLEIFFMRSHGMFGGTSKQAIMNIPLEERDEIIEIIKTSPSALKFVLTFKENISKNITYLGIPYQQYVDRDKKIIYEVLEKEDVKKIDHDKCIKLIDEAFSNRDKLPSPLYSVLKSLMINDIFQDRIVENKWFWEFYKNTFFRFERSGY